MKTQSEIRLTIANTEELYKEALQITDFVLDNNQISNLMSAALRQMQKNGSEWPQMLTDLQIREIKEAVRDEVYGLQEVAK